MGLRVDVTMDCSSWADVTPHCFHHKADTAHILCWSNKGGDGVLWDSKTTRSICRKRKDNVCKKGGTAKSGMTIGNNFYNKDNIKLNDGLEDNTKENSSIMFNMMIVMLLQYLV